MWYEANSKFQKRGNSNGFNFQLQIIDCEWLIKRRK